MGILYLYFYIGGANMDNITKKEIDAVVGKIVREYRLKRNLTQEELAENLGLTTKYISRIENGASGLGDETLIKYIDYLGITPNSLYEEFLTNENIKRQLEISKEINKLPENKLDFLVEFIEILKNMK